MEKDIKKVKDKILVNSLMVALVLWLLALCPLKTNAAAKNAWVTKLTVKNTVCGRTIKPKAKAKSGKVIYIYSSAKNGKYTRKQPAKVGTWYVKAKVKKTAEYSSLVSKPVKFKIIPKGTRLRRVASKKSYMVVSWSVQKKQTSGYQVQYAANKKFRNAKSVFVKGNNRIKTNITKPNKKKTYYVRIRTFKIVKKKKYFSAWSKALKEGTSNKTQKSGTVTTSGDILIHKGDKTKSTNLYYVEDWAANSISIPSSFHQKVKIGVVKMDEKPSFHVLSGDTVTVDKNRVVKPKVTYMYWKNGFGISVKPKDMTGVTIEKSYDSGKSVVGVRVGNKTYKVNVTVNSYTEYYSNQVMDTFIRKRISSGMTQKQKLDAIVSYVAKNFDYSVKSSSAVGMIINGGGDCWASTGLICELSKKAGLRSMWHSANWEAGAGSGHHNALVEADGEIYECDAGYSGSKPRYYSMTKYTKGFAYYVSNNKAYLTQYASFDKPSSVTIPNTLDGYPVAGITRSIFYQMVGLEEVAIKKIVVPASVEELDDQAFYTGTTTLEKVEISPDNQSFANENGAVYSKDKKVLYYVPSKKSGNFTVNADTERINAYAFSFCQNIAKVSVGEKLKSVGYAAFWRSGITEIILPESVTEIGEGAFAQCEKAVVTVRSKTASVGENAFYNNKLVRGYAGTEVEKVAKSDSVKFEALQE